MTATRLQQYGHSRSLSANFEGSMQTLPDGNVFLGWGQIYCMNQTDASARLRAQTDPH